MNPKTPATSLSSLPITLLLTCLLLLGSALAENPIRECNFELESSETEDCICPGDLASTTVGINNTLVGQYIQSSYSYTLTTPTTTDAPLTGTTPSATLPDHGPGEYTFTMVRELVRTLPGKSPSAPCTETRTLVLVTCPITDRPIGEIVGSCGPGSGSSPFEIFGDSAECCESENSFLLGGDMPSRIRIRCVSKDCTLNEYEVEVLESSISWVSGEISGSGRVAIFNATAGLVTIRYTINYKFTPPDGATCSEASCQVVKTIINECCLELLEIAEGIEGNNDEDPNSNAPKARGNKVIRRAKDAARVFDIGCGRKKTIRLQIVGHCVIDDLQFRSIPSGPIVFRKGDELHVSLGTACGEFQIEVNSGKRGCYGIFKIKTACDCDCESHVLGPVTKEITAELDPKCPQCISCPGDGSFKIQSTESGCGEKVVLDCLNVRDILPERMGLPFNELVALKVDEMVVAYCPYVNSFWFVSVFPCKCECRCKVMRTEYTVFEAFLSPVPNAPPSSRPRRGKRDVWQCGMEKPERSCYDIEATVWVRTDADGKKYPHLIEHDLGASGRIPCDDYGDDFQETSIPPLPPLPPLQN